MRSVRTLSFLLPLCLAAASSAQHESKRARPGAKPAVTALPSAGIAWFGTWERGSAEAKRSGKPILLISAAPHCRNISGLW